MPIAKGSVNAEPASSMEGALRRKSLHLSGPLSGMPAGATSVNTPVINVVPAKRQSLLQGSETRMASWLGYGLHAEGPQCATASKKHRQNNAGERGAGEAGSPGHYIQGVMQLRSGRRSQDDRPLTPHFIASVPRGPEVTKLRSLIKLCGLRTTGRDIRGTEGPGAMQAMPTPWTHPA